MVWTQHKHLIIKNKTFVLAQIQDFIYSFIVQGIYSLMEKSNILTSNFSPFFLL
jgi:hypothetical protein